MVIYILFFVFVMYLSEYEGYIFMGNLWVMGVCKRALWLCACVKGFRDPLCVTSGIMVIVDELGAIMHVFSMLVG